MPKIRFTTSPKIPRDMADRPYVAGWEGEVSDSEAQRWLNRGVAELVTEEEVKVEVKEEVKAPSSPEPPAAPVENKSEGSSSSPLSAIKSQETHTSLSTPMLGTRRPPTPKE